MNTSGYPELREKIQQTVGEASTCWENLDSAGIFDSDRASRIAVDLYKYVVEFIGGLDALKNKEE